MDENTTVETEDATYDAVEPQTTETSPFLAAFVAGVVATTGAILVTKVVKNWRTRKAETAGSEDVHVVTDAPAKTA